MCSDHPQTAQGRRVSRQHAPRFLEAWNLGSKVVGFMVVQVDLILARRAEIGTPSDRQSARKSASSACWFSQSATVLSSTDSSPSFPSHQSAARRSWSGVGRFIRSVLLFSASFGYDLVGVKGEVPGQAESQVKQRGSVSGSDPG